MIEEKKENLIATAEGVEFSMLGQDRKEDSRGEKIRLLQDFQTFEIQVTVPDTDATDVDKYPVFYIAHSPCFFIEARERHEVNSSSGTLDIERLTSGTVKGGGTSVLVGVFSTALNAKTVQRRTPTLAGLSSINLNPGDALALKPGGTLTGASSIMVGVLLGMNTKDIPVSAGIS